MTAKNTKADLVLHPIRMRILMALSGRQKTSQQLADDLWDIPQATLYRQITRLAEANIIKVVEKRQVRGAVEKVYAVDEHSTTLTSADFAKSSKDDHMRYFISFIASLLDDFSRYMQRSESPDLAVDGVGYHKFQLELSDKELKSMSVKLNAVFALYLDNQPRPDRRRRIFTSILMPDVAATVK